MAKVFISWSGKETASFKVAKKLYEWLPLVLQSTEPFMSDNITAGTDFINQIMSNLSSAKVGIICITKENVVSEVGALIETIKSKYGYNWGDFVKIIHIADTDGAFTKNCIKEAEVENIQDDEDYMEYFDIEKVEK